METKQCKICNKIVPINEYYIYKRGQDKLRSECKKCTSIVNKQSRIKHRNKRLEYAKRYSEANRKLLQTRAKNYYHKHKGYYRNSYLTRTFGISLEKFNSMLEEQGNKCFICHENFKNNKDTCIDHNHACCNFRKSCGKCVRHLLCIKCNALLGLANDNTTILIYAILYLINVNNKLTPQLENVINTLANLSKKETNKIQFI